MTNVDNWELVDIRRHPSRPTCHERDHAVSVGWLIKVDGDRQLIGWCFTCDNRGSGIKGERPKSEWPERDNDVPVVRDNRPACRDDQIGRGHEVVWLPSQRFSIWYRACFTCRTLVATTTAWHFDHVDDDKRPMTLEDAQRSAEFIDHQRTLTALCSRCGATGKLHSHHWAPRALFTDADWWPQSLLCPSCHSRWHSTVTPGMRRK